MKKSGKSFPKKVTSVVTCCLLIISSIFVWKYTSHKNTQWQHQSQQIAKKTKLQYAKNHNDTRINLNTVANQIPDGKMYSVLPINENTNQLAILVSRNGIDFQNEMNNIFNNLRVTNHLVVPGNGNFQIYALTFTSQNGTFSTSVSPTNAFSYNLTLDTNHNPENIKNKIKCIETDGQPVTSKDELKSNIVKAGINFLNLSQKNFEN